MINIQPTHASPDPIFEATDPRPTSSIYSRPIGYNDEHVIVTGNGRSDSNKFGSWIGPAMRRATQRISSVTSLGGLMRRFDSPSGEGRETEITEGPEQPATDTARVAKRNPSHDDSDSNSSECICEKCQRDFRVFKIVFVVVSIMVIIILIIVVLMATGVFNRSATNGGVLVSTTSSSPPSTMTKDIRTEHNSRSGIVSIAETPASSSEPTSTSAPTPTPTPAPTTTPTPALSFTPSSTFMPPSIPMYTISITKTISSTLLVTQTLPPSRTGDTETTSTISYVVIITTPLMPRQSHKIGEPDITTTMYSPVTTVFVPLSKIYLKAKSEETNRSFSEDFPTEMWQNFP
ncbi:hypothetical protein CIHG_08922 [Coccidioides immitis H538.4]|nr:hypothetical protein CIRG_05286 [Coccidioides immitis RMSCC 2394]KMU77911.1 hypothetical protein CISG_06754 [Coccidioides immitis RMSCC 3703]KMU91173.1 hypothetical protein CIHG_08922 [Coccidioides immitis H538.4]TPX21891.1 hypothetical protein DIZ76_015856 [Coccidioides immitis]